MITPKIALITGGSRGLGKSIALNVASKGIDVVLTYRINQVEAEATVTEIEALGRRAVALPLDVADVTGFDAFYTQLTTRLQTTFETNRFDVLINNAGISLRAPIAEATEAVFDELVNTNLKGVYFFTQKGLPLLQDGGRIINLSTGVTRYSFPGNSAYAITKGGIEVFTRYLALELGSRGITANSIAAGATLGGATWQDTPEERDFVAGSTALGRVGLPDDIGEVAAILCTDEARWINGQRIEVTGGIFL